MRTYAYAFANRRGLHVLTARIWRQLTNQEGVMAKAKQEPVADNDGLKKAVDEHKAAIAAKKDEAKKE